MPDHDDALAERRSVGLIGVAVQQARHRTRTPRKRCPRHRELRVAVHAGRQHHHVVCCAQRLERHVGAEAHVAPKFDALLGEQAIELPGDCLRALVIRGHAVAHKAVRGGEPIDHLDRSRGKDLSQGLRGKASRRA